MKYLNFKEEISLKEIYSSGQCFRWQDLGNDTYRIIAGTHLADIRQISRTKIAIKEPASDQNTDAKKDSGFWEQYFDLETSYRAIQETIPPSDAYLLRAAKSGAGIRILRQDPWEMIVTFIISQRKNIPAIRTCVEKLCRVSGRKITLSGPDVPEEDSSQICSLFPSPQEILALRCCKAEGLPEDGPVPCSFKAAGFQSCSLGYRMPYIRDAASWMSKHRINGLSSLSDEDLLKALMEIKGVGIKVASCIMLFGFHRLNAFPVDVWMKRVQEKQYPKGFSLNRYAAYAGVMQQYLFCQVRKES